MANRLKTKRAGRLATTALMTAVTAALSILAIPTPMGVPLTLQTFAVALSGVMLGGFSGTLSVAVYISLGAMGLPIFAGFGSGIGYVSGPTGGFIFGFLYLAVFAGLAGRKPKPIGLLIILSGLLLCHLSGIVWFAAVTKRELSESFLLVSLPYLLKDIPSVAAALFFGRALRDRLKL